MSDANPLSTARPRPAEAKPDPMLRHAQIWRHVNTQPPDALQAHVQVMDHALPVLGALAGDPDVTAKQVIKAAAALAADGQIQPSKAVAVIADMPADPDKLRPWLRERYADALATTVHAKAALLRQAQPAPMQPGAAPAPDAAVPQPATPQPTQPTQPGATP